jgi:putative addiction module component (TIGR02574 family)
MSDRSIELLKEALQLPLAERGAIVRQLIRSLEPDESSEDYEAVWAREVEARLNRLDAGDLPGIEGAESVRRLRDRLDRR